MSNSNGSQKATAWFIVGFLVVAVVGIIIAGVVSSGSSNAGPKSDIPAPAITESDWGQGPRDAKVTLIEYGDFQCPACGTYYPMVNQLVKEYGDKVLFVFRNFPLYSIHPNAGVSARAAEAAGLQGKYWEMNHMLYESQRAWSNADPRKVTADYFEGYAKTIGLDVERFKKDIESNQVLNKIKADVDAANDIGVSQTPTFYLNLKQINSPLSYDEFKSAIEQALNAS